ncbi:MAG: hypothetical protein WBR13_07350 [Allosphingosinicella sp.]
MTTDCAESGPFDLQGALGASRAATLQKFSLYLPDRDRDGAPVASTEAWHAAAMTLFADVNGGATLLPPADGIWNPDDGGEIVRESTRVVYSFIRDGERFERDFDQLAVFIHSFGKHTRQGEVMVEFSGDVPGRGFVSRAYFVEEFSKAGPPPF